MSITLWLVAIGALTGTAGLCLTFYNMGRERGYRNGKVDEYLKWRTICHRALEQTRRAYYLSGFDDGYKSHAAKCIETPTCGV